ncbi:MAG: DUF3169 family protein [Solibacillus sp.]
MKVLKQLGIGALIGGFFGYVLVGGSFTLPTYDISTELMVIFTIIAFFLCIFSLSGLTAIKKKAAQTLSGEEEDLRDEWSYKKYSDVTLASTTALVLSIATVCIGIITEASIPLVIVSLVSTIFSVIVSLMPSKYMRYVYPDRNLPNPNDKNYMSKLLEASDEGERHIMLNGLYSVYNLTSLLLLLAIVLFMFYSVATGESQLFSILVISLILISINTQYIFKIRSK